MERQAIRTYAKADRNATWQQIKRRFESENPNKDLKPVSQKQILHWEYHLRSLAHIEGLLLFSLQAEPTANINELQEVLRREQKRIEALEIRRWQ